MKTRILTAAIGLPVVFLIMFSFKTIFFNIILTLIVFLAIHEAIAAYKIKNGVWLALCYLPAVAALMFRQFDFMFKYTFPLCSLTLFFIVLFTLVSFEKTSVADICGATVLSGIALLCFYCMVYFKVLLPTEQYGYDGVYLILMSLGYAWGGDSAAYFIGRLLGKRKMAPAISPNKTIAGAIAALFGSGITGCIVTAIYGIFAADCGIMALIPSKVALYIGIMIVGVFAAVLGMIGDLFASAVKRQTGIKDYGKIFPGHGGILDRFDSVMLILPLVAAVVYIILDLSPVV